MTITRLFSCIALLATLGACGWTGEVHAQQQPAAASSTAAAPKTQVSVAAHAVARAQPAKQASKTASTAHVQSTVAVNATVDIDKEPGRYQSRTRSNMDPYRNAVTPPVDSGR